MDQKKYNLITRALFLVIGAFHLARVVLGWDLIMGGWAVPQALSILAVLFLGYLVYGNLKISKK